MAGRLATVVLVFSWVAVTCQPQTPTDPEAVYRSFYQAIQDKDWDTVVERLAPEVVERLRQTGQRMMRLQGREGLDPLEFMLLNASADYARPLQSVKVVSRSEGVAVLEITAGPCRKDKKCVVSEVTVRRHAGSWVLAPRMPPLLHGPRQPDNLSDKETQ